MTEKIKAIQLFSGGLDSILSAAVMKREGFDVKALHIYTGFTGNIQEEIDAGAGYIWKPSENVLKIAGYLGIELIPLDLSDEYPELLLNPKYGYGSCGNPCIDCHIFFLEKAREFMDKVGAPFVFTGEVLGQRPMSQHKKALLLIEKRSGLEGRLLRPLSAKLLAPTIAETDGIVKRENLYAINGRSRKPQFELAREFGITAYPTPGGGCFLTDVSFGKRFRELINRSAGKKIHKYELYSLKTGRHIYLPDGIKVITGRTQKENDYLMWILGGNCWMFDARDYNGASVFAFGEPKEDDFINISRITARYSKGSNEKKVVIIAVKGSEKREFIIEPAKPEEIDPFVIN